MKHTFTLEVETTKSQATAESELLSILARRQPDNMHVTMKASYTQLDCVTKKGSHVAFTTYAKPR